MKKTIILLLLTYSGVVSLEAKAQVEETSPNEVVNGPIISIDKNIHDYGTIENGADGSCVFVVTNTGNSPLIISDCKKTCGCTVPTWPREPIAPGASAEINVKYDTKRTGTINKSVTIISNATNAPSKVVRIKGTIKSKPEGNAPANSSGPTNG